MSDTVSRKSLLKFLYANYKENELSQAGKALDYVIKKIEADAFPSTESEGEAYWRTLYEQERDLSNEQKNHLRTEIESLKAITELAVKGLKEIACLNVDSDYSAGTIARNTFFEIEKLQK